VVDNCPIADPVHQVQERIQDVLRSVTLAQIARGSAFGQGGRQEHDDVAEAADLSR
jgi:DNA-binding IscR family transcriptional regulator